MRNKRRRAISGLQGQRLNAGKFSDTIALWQMACGSWNRKNDRVTIAQEFKSKIALVFGNTGRARVAFVFGSHVRGTTWAESDLDIAVRWDWQLGDVERFEAKLDLIDVLTTALGAVGERADIVDLDRVNSAVAFRAITEGICVFARDEAERVDAIVRTCRRYDDDAPRRALFRQAALDAVQRLKERSHGQP
jgi:predicted nucleotidyltransferase